MDAETGPTHNVAFEGELKVPQAGVEKMRDCAVACGAPLLDQLDPAPSCAKSEMARPSPPANCPSSGLQIFCVKGVGLGSSAAPEAIPFGVGGIDRVGVHVELFDQATGLPRAIKPEELFDAVPSEDHLAQPHQGNIVSAVGENVGE